MFLIHIGVVLNFKSLVAVPRNLGSSLGRCAINSVMHMQFYYDPVNSFAVRIMNARTVRLA
jgi:hypothetical protein